MNFDDDSMIGRFLQRLVFIANLAVWLYVVCVGVVTIFQFPSYVIRWYQVDEPKESNYFGWLCLSKLLGIYGFLVFFGYVIFYDFVSVYWPTFSGLIFDGTGIGEMDHGFSVLFDCLAMGIASWCV